MERRERRRRVYSERVDWLMMEVYTTAPTIMFRDIVTGRFVKPPPIIFVKAVMGAETGGGSEPIEVEVVASREVRVDELERLEPRDVGTYLDEVEKGLYDECFDVVLKRFGGLIADLLEERGRELTTAFVSRVTLRYRHYRRYAEWKVMTFG